MKVNNYLKEIRMAKNISSKELAYKADVSIQTIQSIEKNKYIPTLVLGLIIAKILDKDINDIFLLVNENESN